MAQTSIAVCQRSYNKEENKNNEETIRLMEIEKKKKMLAQSFGRGRGKKAVELYERDRKRRMSNILLEK